MAKKGVYLDPTIVCNLSAKYIAERERLIREAGFNSDADTVAGRIMVSEADERSQAHAKNAREVLMKAYEAGIKITTGSDSNPIDEMGILEIEQLVFSGLPEMAAIMAATKQLGRCGGHARQYRHLGSRKAGRPDSCREEPSRKYLQSPESEDGDQGTARRVNLARDEGQIELLEALFSGVAAVSAELRSSPVQFGKSGRPV